MSFAMAALLAVSAIVADPTTGDRDAWIGRKVMPKKECVVKIGDRVIETTKAPPYRVDSVRDGWLYIGVGYVQPQHVVAVEDAVEYYADYLQRNRNSRWAYWHRASAHEALKQWDAAVRDHDRVVQLRRSATSYFARARVYVLKHDYDRALADLNAALRLDPRYAAGYAARTFVWTRKGEYDRAVRDGNVAVKLNPAAADAYGNRGEALLRRGDDVAALRDFEKSIALQPSAEALNCRGMTYILKEKHDEARKDFDEALRLDPECVLAYTNRAGAACMRGDYAAAVDDCDAALRLDPQCSAAYLNRGMAAFAQRRYRQARDDYERSLALAPDSHTALSNLSILLATCPEDAVRDGKQSVELATRLCELTQWKDFDYVDVLACAYAEVGDFEAAVKHEAAAMKLAGEHGEEVNRYEEFIACFRAGKPYRLQTNGTIKIEMSLDGPRDRF